MTAIHPELFPSTPVLPPGMHYGTQFLSVSEERSLAQTMETLSFQPYAFQQYLAKRRVSYFGWRYDYGSNALMPAPALPTFLLELRLRAAEFAKVAAEELGQAMVTEYAPGAGIGWHRDRSVFGEVIGISLLAPCNLRFRLPTRDRWERVNVPLEPRSIYLLQADARSDWYHSIPAVKALRYSITFRRYNGGSRPHGERGRLSDAR